MKSALAVFSALLMLSYPAVVYFGLRWWSVGPLGLVLVVLMLLLALLRFGHARRAVRESGEPLRLRWVVTVPLLIVSLITLGSLVSEPLLIELVPVVINLALLVAFGSSLRGKTSMVERFARLQGPELTPARISYCRKVTIAWCVFFVFNATITAILAAFFPVSWWSLHTGLIAYCIMGALFAGEYVLRRIRFDDYGAQPHDRLLKRLLSPRTNAAETNDESSTH